VTLLPGSAGAHSSLAVPPWPLLLPSLLSLPFTWTLSTECSMFDLRRCCFFSLGLGHWVFNVGHSLFLFFLLRYRCLSLGPWTLSVQCSRGLSIWTKRQVHACGHSEPFRAVFALDLTLGPATLVPMAE